MGPLGDCRGAFGAAFGAAFAGCLGGGGMGTRAGAGLTMSSEHSSSRGGHSQSSTRTQLATRLVIIISRLITGPRNG